MTDQIIDLCYSLHIMRVPLDYNSYVFRDNHTIIQLIENAQRHFQGSLFGCFEYVPYTALTIVLIIETINVRLD